MSTMLRLPTMLAPAASLVLAVVLTAAAAHAADDHYVEILRKYGIEPTADSIGAYLESLHPTQDALREYRNWIAQLGDDDFRRREAALKQLLRSPVSSVELLRQAAAGNDAEVAYRAKLVLEQGNDRWAQLLHAVYCVVREREIRGLVPAILGAAKYHPSDHVRHAAHGALKATVRPEDSALLVSALGSDNAEVRFAAIDAFGVVADDDAMNFLRQLLDDQQPAIRLAAARALADRGDRACLAPLTELLSSADVRVRNDSLRILRGLTGQQFGLRSYDDAESREQALRQWRDWVAAKGATAKLTFPVKFGPVELGRTIICRAAQHEVIELDEQGKQVWQQGELQYPWRAVGLPNGHRLVASYNGRFAAEFDAQGKEVWRKDELPGGPHSVTRLENGNTLLACSDSHEVVEITPNGETAWSIHIDGRPTDAVRLEDGRTLIVLKNGSRVVEVDRDGKVLWEIPNLQWPNTAQRLENGNTLIAEVQADRVVEFDRGGKVVWSHTINAPYDAQRLANGNTLIAQNSLVTIIDPAGKVIWSHATTGDTRVSRY